MKSQFKIRGLVGALAFLSAPLIATAIPRGDGVIIDAVAQDVHCASGVCQSNLVDQILTFQKSAQNVNRIVYYFPDFMNIRQPDPTDPNPYSKFDAKNPGASIQSNCPAAPKNTQYFVNYLVLPLLAVEGRSDLGECLSGAQATEAYNTLNGQKTQKVYVLPMVNGSADVINNPLDGSTISNIAAALASAVLADPNASGLSFDLEGESFADENPQNAISFLQQLSKALGPNRYIAIFDGVTLARAFVKAGIPFPANAFVLDALYDDGLINSGGQESADPVCHRPSVWSPNNPYTPLQYDHCSTTPLSYFSKPDIGASVPVMFVLPAAATTQLYESVEVMNTGVNADVNADNHGPSASDLPADTPEEDADNLSDREDCLGASQTDSSELLKTIVCPLMSASEQDQFDKAKRYSCQVSSGTPDEWFFQSDNCNRFEAEVKNKGNVQPIHQTDYMTIALNKVATQSPGHSNYLGVVLYNVKPESATASGFTSAGFDPVNCAKHFYSTLGEFDLVSQCITVYPESISDSVWNLYNTWTQNPNK